MAWGLGGMGWDGIGKDWGGGRGLLVEGEREREILGWVCAMCYVYKILCLLCMYGWVDGWMDGGGMA